MLRVIATAISDATAISNNTPAPAAKLTSISTVLGRPKSTSCTGYTPRPQHSSAIRPRCVRFLLAGQGLPWVLFLTAEL